MNNYSPYDEAASELRSYIPDLEQAYIILVVVVPVMIGAILLISLLMLVSLAGISDRLKEILIATEEKEPQRPEATIESVSSNQENEKKSPPVSTTSSLEENTKSVSYLSIRTSILVISVPVLLVVLGLVSAAFR